MSFEEWYETHECYDAIAAGEAWNAAIDEAVKIVDLEYEKSMDDSQYYQSACESISEKLQELKE